MNTSKLADMLNANGKSPFRQPVYVLLSLAIGGTAGGDPSGTTFPARFEIDYVRVFQKIVATPIAIVSASVRPALSPVDPERQPAVGSTIEPESGLVHACEIDRRPQDQRPPFQPAWGIALHGSSADLRSDERFERRPIARIERERCPTRGRPPDALRADPALDAGSPLGTHP